MRVLNDYFFIGIEGTERTELIPVVDFSLSQADWQSTSPTNVKACTSGESDTSEECAEIEYTSGTCFVNLKACFGLLEI